MVDCIKGVHDIKGNDKWRYRGDSNDMYQSEHDELFASIRNGSPINDGDFMAQSTLLAIMGRMAAYTGQIVTYDEALNSQEKLGPEEYSWDLESPVAAVPMPGIQDGVGR
ncbi:MAG: hypothetical protein ACFB15_13815 [Cyclobacteriaceae bacterium]